MVNALALVLTGLLLFVAASLVIAFVFGIPLRVGDFLGLWNEFRTWLKQRSEATNSVRELEHGIAPQTYAGSEEWEQPGFKETDPEKKNG